MDITPGVEDITTHGAGEAVTECMAAAMEAIMEEAFMEAEVFMEEAEDVKFSLLYIFKNPLKK